MALGSKPFWMATNRLGVYMDFFETSSATEHTYFCPNN